VQGQFNLVVRDVPSQPAAPKIVNEDDKQVTISWQAPATNGEPLLDYTITTSGGIQQKTVSAGAAEATITGLTNGKNYTFQISARNALGDSTISKASATAVPFGTPGAPSAPKLTASTSGNGKLTMSWGKASGNGRSVSSYKWTMSGASPASGTVSGSTLTTSATGHVGTAYTFTVVAVGPTGKTSTAARSASATPVPGAPSSASTSASSSGNGSVTMSWGASASTEAISSYSININGGGWQSMGTARSHSFTGSNGTAYKFQVRAVSAGQTSAITTSNSATPSKPDPQATGTTTVNTCPEVLGGSGTHFNPNGPTCSSKYGFASGKETLYCHTQYGSNTWYLFSGHGASGTYTKADGWIIRGLDMNISGSVPAC
jgi:hypothetical protein